MEEGLTIFIKEKHLDRVKKFLDMYKSGRYYLEEIVDKSDILEFLVWLNREAE